MCEVPDYNQSIIPLRIYCNLMSMCIDFSFFIFCFFYRSIYHHGMLIRP